MRRGPVLFAVMLATGIVACSKRPSSQPTDEHSGNTKPSLGAANEAAPSLTPPVHRAEPVPEPPADKWEVHTSTSEMDDSTHTSLALQAEKPVEGLGGIKAFAGLMVSCRDGAQPAIAVLAGVPMQVELGEDDIEVQIRFDSEKPLTQRWSPAKDNTFAFAPKPADLLGRLLRAHTFRFKFTALMAGSEVVTFDVRGLERHTEPLKGCLAAK